ncbi:hypothetical protein [Fastidiosibacter lacustris]|uniref:hypothetical protein n=1 Tax=Fastidiosibacter lacustris TaxID=2056695 RepID=UPI000E34CE52|nr:hypothetical protein [Fastidiosibacter lacustris]
MKQKLRYVADTIFFLSCIAFIATLTIVFYFNNFSIIVKGHAIYWVYLAPLLMVLYTFLRNLLFTNKPKSTNSENTLEPNHKTS